MSQDASAGAQPDPAANRAQWNPEGDTVDATSAAGQVADQLGAAAPAAGVSDSALGAQMAAAGATAGLPHETQMDALMEQVRKMSAEIAYLQQQDAQREQTAVAALGEPILQRYAKGLHAKLQAVAAANPGSDDHFAQAIDDAANLVTASKQAISRGGNDLGQVHSLVSRLEHFLTHGHRRTAPGQVRHADLSAAEQDLEYAGQEANKLADSAAQRGAPVGAITATAE